MPGPARATCRPQWSSARVDYAGAARTPVDEAPTVAVARGAAVDLAAVLGAAGAATMAANVRLQPERRKGAHDAATT